MTDGRTNGTAATGARGSAERIARVRRFNRFYTRRIGVLDRGHLASPYSLAEVRVLYELAHWRDTHDAPPNATDIRRELGVDAGYLSRMLRGFERRRLVTRTRSRGDARQQELALTRAGRATFAELDARARDAIVELLAPLGRLEQERLVGAMRTVESVLAPGSTARQRIALRHPRPGDLGWVVERHGALYAAEYGWDVRFEALVARIVADFAARHDPKRERCWIAELDGEKVGSVFLVRHPHRRGVAKLRLLLVEPSARGLGVGRRLVRACTLFARRAGYHTITLWTNSVLTSARRIYEAEGYQLVHEAPHRDFGRGLVGQTWELTLDNG